MTKDYQKLSLTEFKRNTAKYLKKIKNNRRPGFLTVNGRVELVAQDARAYQELRDRIERAVTTVGLRQGIEAFNRGEGRHRRKHSMTSGESMVYRVDDLPSAEWQLIRFVNSHYEGNTYARPACFRQNKSAISSVRQQTIAIKSHPLTRVFSAVLDQPLLFPSALGIRRTRLNIVFSSHRLSGLARSCLAHEVIRETHLLFIGERF